MQEVDARLHGERSLENFKDEAGEYYASPIQFSGLEPNGTRLRGQCHVYIMTTEKPDGSSDGDDEEEEWEEGDEDWQGGSASEEDESVVGASEDEAGKGVGEDSGGDEEK